MRHDLEQEKPAFYGKYRKYLEKDLQNIRGNDLWEGEASGPIILELQY